MQGPIRGRGSGPAGGGLHPGDGRVPRHDDLLPGPRHDAGGGRAARPARDLGRGGQRSDAAVERHRAGPNRGRPARCGAGAAEATRPQTPSTAAEAMTPLRSRRVRGGRFQPRNADRASPASLPCSLLSRPIADCGPGVAITSMLPPALDDRAPATRRFDRSRPRGRGAGPQEGPTSCGGRRGPLSGRPAGGPTHRPDYRGPRTAALTHWWRLRRWRPERHGQPCRVLIRARGPGPRNILVEFADGERLISTRWAVRRLAVADAD